MNEKQFNARHNRNLEQLKRRIEKVFDTAAKEAAAIGGSLHSFNPDKEFTFDDYPETAKSIKRLLQSIHDNTTAIVNNGIDIAWALSNDKNDALVAQVIPSAILQRLNDIQLAKYYNNNDTARQAFHKRQVGGLNLSDRVWRYTDAFKSEIEMALDIGIRQGMSAAEMTSELKQYLRHPNKLFRRVRDEKGNLHLSKAAADFHPGRGVYRSSFMNARRLSATETNIAYHSADYTRWQQLDFVVGIEIRLSGNHTCLDSNGRPQPFTDICDELQGQYPKEFNFTGWHPHCRCQAITITKTPQEIAEATRRLLQGKQPSTESEKKIKNLPPQFKKWCEKNAERIENLRARGKEPYYIRDNAKLLGEKSAEPLTPLKNAEAQHDGKTPQQGASIKSESIEALRTRLGSNCPSTLRRLGEAITNYEAGPNYGPIAKRNKVRIEQTMKRVFEVHDLGMNIKEENLEKVLLSSTFKNTFQTGTSKGYLGSGKTTGKIEVRHRRLRTAHQLWGLGKDLENDQLPRREYEKYGNLLDHNILNSLQTNTATHYGKVEVRFKKDKVLATWTPADSLDARCQPSLVSDPKACSYDRISTKAIFKENEPIDNLKEFKDIHVKQYIEIQYHGDLTIDCVESVSFPYDIRQGNHADARNLAQKCKEKGIAVYYIGEEGGKKSLIQF